MTKQTTSFLSGPPRVWLLSVFIMSSVALAGCGGQSTDVGEAAHDPMQDAHAKAEEARARLMASEGGQMVLDVI